MPGSRTARDDIGRPCAADEVGELGQRTRIDALGEDDPRRGRLHVAPAHLRPAPVVGREHLVVVGTGCVAVAGRDGARRYDRDARRAASTATDTASARRSSRARAYPLTSSLTCTDVGAHIAPRRAATSSHPVAAPHHERARRARGARRRGRASDSSRKPGAVGPVERCRRGWRRRRRTAGRPGPPPGPRARAPGGRRRAGRG